MKLFGWCLSSAAFRVRIALNLKGIAYEEVDLIRDTHLQPEFLALNPQGLVPVLQDGDVVLSQSLAIIEYLDETHAAPPLLPRNPVERARVRSVAQFFAADTHPLMTPRTVRYLRGPLGHDRATTDVWSRHWTAEALNAVETMLSRDGHTTRFAFGEEPGLADICLAAQIVIAEDLGMDLAYCPTLARIFHECLSLAAFERAHPRNQPGGLAPQ